MSILFGVGVNMGWIVVFDGFCDQGSSIEINLISLQRSSSSTECRIIYGQQWLLFSEYNKKYF